MRLASFTPLRVNWPHPLVSLPRGIRIIETPIFKENDWRVLNLRRTEEEIVLTRKHWLTVEVERDYVDHDALNQRSVLLRNAMLGFNVWAPKGWDGLVIDGRLTDSGVAVERASFPEPYAASHWGKVIDLEKIDVSDLAVLVDGTLAAFESGVVRIVNPFQFLEIGLQTAVNHRRAGPLLWIMGLDGLLAAEKQEKFARRLIRLLGQDTLLFPEDYVGRRPKYSVGEIASKAFDLRNLIAHGKEILESFRQPIQFRFDPPELQSLGIEGWTYETLLYESSLFAFHAALRQIIKSGNLALLGHKRKWENWLDSPTV
jgi:hypothetical protein